MKTYRILLKPKGIIKDTPSSETLFGAICWGIRTLYSEEKLTAILSDFNNCKERFIPSSAFPLLKFKDSILPCYPIPILPDPKIKDIEQIAREYESQIIQEAEVEIDENNKHQFSKRTVISKYKGFKKIEYLTESLFNRLISGEKIVLLYRQYLVKKLEIAKIDESRILLKNEEFAEIKGRDLIKKRTSARNKIDRLSFSTVPGGEIYYEEDLYLKPDVFQLYFLLLTDDIEFFTPIFRWLSDTGIGGNRTVGRGHFQIEVEGEVNFPNAADSHLFIPLSKYLPTDNEIDWQNEKNYYELIPYQPRFDTMFFKGGEFIKERVTYLKEGSILQAKERKEYYGRLYPSAKFQNQTIYQCGFTIPVFLKMEG
jgi:CRISPR-associated protein Csm4